jgi:hypothetical protein
LHGADIKFNISRMELKIAREILDQAGQCAFDHRCLVGELLSDPQPQTFGPERFLCREPGPCAYKFPFGLSFFCTCPVRQAIYDTYGK